MASRNCAKISFVWAPASQAGSRPTGSPSMSRRRRRNRVASSRRISRACRQHPLREAARREGGQAEGLARRRSAGRVREARRDHARDLRPVGAVALGPRSCMDRSSIVSCATCGMRPCRSSRRCDDRRQRDEAPGRVTRYEAPDQAAARLWRVRARAWRARRVERPNAQSDERRVGPIISENYDWVVAAQDMKESLERQDSAALFDLLGQRDRARGQVAEHRARFDAALDKAAANITEIGEARGDRRIRNGRDEYYRRFDAFLNASGRSNAAVLPRRSNRSSTRSGPMRPPAPEPGGDAPKGRRRLAHRAPLVFRHAGAGRLLMAAGIAVEIGLSKAIIGPVRQLTAATTRLAAGSSIPPSPSVPATRSARSRSASTGWPSGSASCGDRTWASCSSRSRRPKPRSIRCTTR